MNIAATAEKKSSVARETMLARILPDKSSELILFWVALPGVLFLLNIGVSLLKPCSFTRFLPFLTIASAAATWRFKTLGISASFACFFYVVWFFFPDLAQEEKLWQMGTIFTLTLNLFILLLASEEMAACIEQVGTQNDQLLKLTHQKELDLQHLKMASAEKEEELSREIEKLKSEAELRRIEKISEMEKLELIHAEIDMLNLQKDAFIEESKKARESVVEKVQLLEEQKERCASLQKEFSEASQKLSAAQAEIDRGELLQEELNISYLAKEKLEKELFDASQKVKLSQEELKQLQEQKEQLENSLVELQLALNESKEKILTLEKRPVQIDELNVEAFAECKKALARAEGVVKQQRLQFKEKNDILSQTRQDLFQTQSKLLLLERETYLAELDPDQGEMRNFEKEIAKLDCEIEVLEEEVTALEELISHVLSQ